MPVSPAGAGISTRRAPAPDRSGEVARDGCSGGRQIGRSVDRDRVASAALDHDGPTEERTDRRGLHVEPATEQGEPGELRLEVRGAAIELGAPVDEEADDAALERDRIDPTEVEGGQPGGRGGVAERRQAVVAGVPSTRRTAGTRACASATIRSWSWAGPGATTASAGAGMIARSPVSSASNAGTVA